VGQTARKRRFAGLGGRACRRERMEIAVYSG
jgi:hypothetical protein